jgi:hypothetical protein
MYSVNNPEQCDQSDRHHGLNCLFYFASLFGHNKFNIKPSLSPSGSPCPRTVFKITGQSQTTKVTEKSEFGDTRIYFQGEASEDKDKWMKSADDYFGWTRSSSDSDSRVLFQKSKEFSYHIDDDVIREGDMFQIAFSSSNNKAWMLCDSFTSGESESKMCRPVSDSGRASFFTLLSFPFNSIECTG